MNAARLLGVTFAALPLFAAVVIAARLVKDGRQPEKEKDS